MSNQVNKENELKTHSFIGKVISNKMEKTIVVLVERLVRHAKYKKFIKRKSKLVVHDEKNVCKEGEIVAIKPGKPISKRKNWILVSVLDKK